MYSKELSVLLQKIADTGLYRNVGGPVNDSTVVVVDTWQKAYELSTSIEWENFGLDRHNEMRIGDSNDQDFGKFFNQFVDDVKGKLHPIVRREASRLPVSQDIQTEVFNSTTWHLLHACDEVEFADLTSSRWHLELAQWYLRGHFPCGWEGEWPEDGPRNGRLIIF